MAPVLVVLVRVLVVRVMRRGCRSCVPPRCCCCCCHLHCYCYCYCCWL